MKNYRLVLGGILVIGTFFGALQMVGSKRAVELAEKKSLPIAILIDQSKKSEKEINTVMSLLDSMKSGQFPILVSKSVLNRLLVIIQGREDPEIQQLFQDWLKDFSFAPYDGKSGWKIFDVNNGLFVLMVPGNFLSQHQDDNGLYVDKDGNSTNPRMKDITVRLTKKDWLFFQKLADKQDTFSVDDLVHVFKEKTTTEEEDPLEVIQSLKYWNIIVMGHGHKNKRISDLSVNDFQSLLSFFNTKINTAFLFIDSCYAGGINRIHFKEIAGRQISSALNYLVVVRGVTDQVTFFTPEISFYETIFKRAQSIDRGMGLNNLLKELNIQAKLLHSTHHIPQVLLPGGLEFQTFNIDEKVLSLGYVLAEKHALDQMPIIANSKAAILVYPHQISAQLIVSPKRVEQELWPLRFKDWEDVLIGFELLEEVDKELMEDPNEFPAFHDLQRYAALLEEEKHALFPKFVSMQLDPELKLHWFKNIQVLTATGQASSPKEIGSARGVLQFLRDSFFGTKKQKFFIDQLSGPNDLSLLFEFDRAEGAEKHELETVLQDAIGKEIALQKVFIDAGDFTIKFILDDIGWELNVFSGFKIGLNISRFKDETVAEYIEWFEQQKKEIEALTDRPKESQKPLTEVLKQAIKKQRQEKV